MQLEETVKKKDTSWCDSLNIHLSKMEFKIFSIFQGFKNSEEKSIHLYSNYSNYFLKIIVRKISPMKIIIGILQDKK